MLKISKITLLFLGLSLAFLSCNDDDGKKKEEKPKNQIKVDGKTFEFERGYIISEQIKNGDVVVGSAHVIYLATGDLELEDDLIVSGEGSLLEMFIASDDDNDLVADEYDMDFEGFDFGNVIYFNLFENFSVEEEGVIYDEYYSGDNDGEVTVSRDDDKYIFKIDLGEYVLSRDTEDEETVSEDLTGYFSGELEELTVEDETPGRKALDGKTSRIRKVVRFK